MKKWLILALTVFMLAACNNKEESNTVNSVDNNEESTVGFEALGDEIEEATDVPKDAEKQILAAFDEYIAAFNSKDIDRYINTLSKNPQGFNVDEDIEVAKNVFAQYDIDRTASDVTIVKYSDDEAQVYANLQIKMTEIKTNTDLNSSGRQVTVFANEDGDWKVTSVYYIGNESQEQEDESLTTNTTSQTWNELTYTDKYSTVSSILQDLRIEGYSIQLSNEWFIQGLDTYYSGGSLDDEPVKEVMLMMGFEAGEINK